MSGIWTAVGVAVVGAASTAIASNQAKKTTEGATNAAISEENKALTQQEQLAAPYQALGTANIPTYQSLLTGGGGPNAGANIQNTLAQTPGYNAALTTGTEAAQRAAGASGLNLSGNQVAGVEQFGAQLGDATYQNELNDLLAPIQLGQASAAGQAANIGGAATNISNLLNQQGQTTAGIDANTVAGLTKAASGAASQYTTQQTLAGLNNPAGGGNPYNLGGSISVPQAGYNPTYDPWGNISGVTPIDSAAPAAVADVYAPIPA
jgi:hypothetical protein